MTEGKCSTRMVEVTCHFKDGMESRVVLPSSCTIYDLVERLREHPHDVELFAPNDKQAAKSLRAVDMSQTFKSIAGEDALSSLGDAEKYDLMLIVPPIRGAPGLDGSTSGRSCCISHVPRCCKPKATSQISLDMIQSATSSCPTLNANRKRPSPDSAMNNLQQTQTAIAVLRALRSLNKKIQAALKKNSDGADSQDDDGTTDDSDPYRDVSEEKVEMLCGMGFSAPHARKALVLCSLNVQAAAEYLIEHVGDPTLDEPLKPLPKVQSPSGESFAPNVVYYEKLKSMGFEEQRILDALEFGNNDFNIACEVLTRGVDVGSVLESQRDSMKHTTEQVVDELLKDARVHAILADPATQEALTNVINNFNLIHTYAADEKLRPLFLLVHTQIANRSTR